MNKTIFFHLVTDESQHAVLKYTLESFNEIRQRIADYAWAHVMRGKVELGRIFYAELREEYSLPASMVQRAIASVSEAMKADLRSRPRFEQYAAMDYQPTMYRWFSFNTVKLSTLTGAPIVCPVEFAGTAEANPRHVLGYALLCLVGAEFYLAVTCRNGKELDVTADELKQILRGELAE